MLIWLALSDGELIIAPKNIYNHTFKLSMLQIYRPRCLKGILHQKIFYRLNLIFWIVMGCGIARFGLKGLKTTET